MENCGFKEVSQKKNSKTNLLPKISCIQVYNTSRKHEQVWVKQYITDTLQYTNLSVITVK